MRAAAFGISRKKTALDAAQIFASWAASVTGIRKTAGELPWNEQKGMWQLTGRMTEVPCQALFSVQRLGGGRVYCLCDEGSRSLFIDTEGLDGTEEEWTARTRTLIRRLLVLCPEARPGRPDGTVHLLSGEKEIGALMDDPGALAAPLLVVPVTEDGVLTQDPYPWAERHTGTAGVSAVFDASVVRALSSNPRYHFPTGGSPVLLMPGRCGMQSLSETGWETEADRAVQARLERTTQLSPARFYEQEAWSQAGKEDSSEELLSEREEEEETGGKAWEEEKADLLCRVERLEREKQALLMQNRSVKGTPLLIRGSETDYYPEEMREAVLNALKEKRDACGERSRGHHLLDAVLKANPSTGDRARYFTALNRGLDQAGDDVVQIRRAMERDGFELVRDKKHFCYRWHGDTRYPVIVSSSPGDYRDAENMRAVVLRTIS